MKRIVFALICLAVAWIALDNHYPSVALFGVGVLTGGMVPAMLRKRRSARTSKPQVRTAREKAA